MGAKDAAPRLNGSSILIQIPPVLKTTNLREVLEIIEEHAFGPVDPLPEWNKNCLQLRSPLEDLYERVKLQDR
eukprot:6451239-Amphidinium_carterae.1